MPRKATGQIIERTGKTGRVFALRFRAYGERQYLTLGSVEEGWSRERAEQELRHVLADVERGIWQASRATNAPAPEPDQTFHEFASRWYADREGDWRPNTRINYRWALTYHLLPYFGQMDLRAITVEAVDAYKLQEKREGTISNNSINKTLTILSQILDEAVEYGKLDRNVAQGKRRRLKREQPSRPVIEPEQFLALLEAADRAARPVYATLAGTGMRPGEALALTWRDVSLATGTIRIRQSKTEAGVREIDLPVGVSEVLSELKARTSRSGPDDPVFLNGRGTPQTKNNLQRQIKVAIGRANESLVKVGIDEIPEEVTPYSFRRLYASLRAARWIDSDGNLRPGDDQVYIAEQMGHTDAALTFRVYQRAVKRRERLTGAHLEAFDKALEWARMGTNEPSAPVETSPNPAPEARTAL